MPRVWIIPNRNSLIVSLTEDKDGMPVDMNASLYRQIIHAQKQQEKFQNILHKFYAEAVQHPKSVRRVR